MPMNDRGFDLWADGNDTSVRASDEENTYPFAVYKQVLNHIYAAVRSSGSRRVLDVGCGTAVLSGRLYAEGCTVTGMDFSRRMLDIAKEKMPGVRLLQWDFSRGLPPELRDERFDAIVCTYALHHLPDAQKISFLRELCAHLAPGGQLLVGDIAFRTRAQREACQQASGEEWDEDEFYFVFEELRRAFPGAEYEQISPCAGVLRLCAGGEA